MTRRVRLGAVNYLNVRPLVHGLDGRPDVSLRFDPPARCAELLEAGEIDLGMVPSITYADRPGDRIVPGICIGSEGPVASVALYARRPMSDVRSIALDTSSRTSAGLVRVLCRRVFGIAPTFVPHAPDLGSMLAGADAALVIGDAALFVDHQAFGAHKIDLGDAWTVMTGLPFVWAFWAGRPDAASPHTVRVLQAAAEAGVLASDAIAADYCRDVPSRIPVAREYLQRHLAFRLTPRALEGLATYFREAREAGVIDEVAVPAFFASDSGAAAPRM